MMRHEEAGRDTLITAERSAATERVRMVPVTLVAEPTAPLCACESPRHSWGEVHSSGHSALRFVPWFCMGCLTAGFIAFPKAADWRGYLPTSDRRFNDVAAPLLALAEAVGEAVDSLGLFVRHASDLLSRRTRYLGVDQVTADLRDGIAQTAEDLRRMYDQAERERRGREAQREAEHRAIMAKLQRRVAKKRERIDQKLARRPAPAASSTYAVIVHGAEAVKPLVYGLVDPAEPNRIRYVGKTLNGAHNRFLGHLAGRRDGRKRSEWIAQLLEEHRPPNMVVLETVPVSADLDARERWWITVMRARGEADLNTAIPSRRGVEAPL